MNPEYEQARQTSAIEAGLAFQRELIKQSTIPLTGATYKLREDIEGIDPKVWEAICYAVTDSILSLPMIAVKAQSQELPEPYEDIVSNAEDWVKKSGKSYADDKRFFGEADSGELMEARKNLAVCKAEYVTAKMMLAAGWVKTVPKESLKSEQEQGRC